jgi:O-antigen/teichoic acid export membrane protein
MTDQLSVPETTRTRKVRTTAARLLRGQSVRHLSWGVIDQGLSSVTTLVVTLSVAHRLGAEHFGAFSLAYVTYGFALTASRALATDPLMVRFGGADVSTWRRAVAGSSGTALVVSLLGSACMFAVAALTPGPTRQAYLALGLVLPALLVQDSWRYAFFAVGRGRQAFFNDLVWAGALVPAMVLVSVTGHQTVFWFLLAWGSGAAVAAAFGLLQTRVLPRLGAARAWLSTHRDLGLRYLAEGASSSAAVQARTVGIGLMLGLAAVGYIQASYTLMGPLMIMMFGTGAVIVPEIARVHRRSPRHMLLVCLAYGGALAAAALAWGITLLITLPRGLGDLVLGEIWEPTYPLVPLTTLAFMGGSLQTGAGAGLRTLGAAKRSLRAMLISSGGVVTFGLLGAAIGGIRGAMVGAVVAAWVGAAIWWHQLRAARRESVGLPSDCHIALAAEPESEGDGLLSSSTSTDRTAEGN